MLDIQQLRQDLDGVATRLAIRGFTLDTTRFSELEQLVKICKRICNVASTA